MDIEEPSMKQDAGICRCCHSEGWFRDLSEKYIWMDDTEVYGDMLQECFNIRILQYPNSNGINGTARLICEDCITCLREACTFRKNVLDNERKLEQMLVQVNTEIGISIKIEPEEPCPKLEPEDIDVEEHGITTRHYPDADDAPFKKPKMEDATPNRARKKVSKSKSDSKWVRSKTPKQKHADNLRTILQYSNAIRFKNKSYLGYICGYCDLTFLEPADLRDHTENEHKNDRLDLQSLKIADIGVKLDITDLKCVLCNENMKDLSAFKDHIVNVHNKEYFTDVKDHMFPFKLHKNLNECVLCDSTFETFKMQYLHMHTHFTNYNCSKCESTFATNKSLISHRYTHRDDHFECTSCDKVFKNKARLHHHVKQVHAADGKVSICPICKSKFPSYYQRNRHMIEAHDTDVFRCHVCSEKFAIKPVLLRHMKVAHKM